MKRLFSQSIDTLVSHVGMLAIGTFASVLINRTLGPGLKGVFVSCLLIPQTAVVFAELGLGTSGAYQLARKKYPQGSVVLFLLIASLILGGLAMLVTGLIIRQPSEIWGGFNRFVILSIIPPGLWLTFLPEIFLGLGLLRGYNGWRTGFQAFRLLLLGFFLFSMNNKLQAVILASVILNWAAFAISASVLCRYIKPRFATLSLVQAKDFLGFGIKVFIGEILGFLHYRADIFLILLWRNNVQVGLYATAAFISELLWMISRGLYAPAFTALAKEGLSRGTVKKAALTVFIATFGLAALSAGLVGPAIKLLYGESFSGAVWPFILLLPGTVLLSIPKFLEAPLIAEMGRPEVLVWSKGIGFLLNISLNFWLIPKHGISGAAVASSVSYSMQAVVFLWMYLRISGRVVAGNAESYALLNEHESDMNEIAD
jgi:O-antigen/teichoic acid export membrane protein